MSDTNSIASTDSQVAAPTTPETACVNLPTHSTPTVHKQSTFIPFTSGHVERDETLIALGKEMVGYVVGPMPTREFLDFLPCNPAKAPSYPKTSFAKLAEQEKETAMYDVFIKAMAAFCPNLVGIDTSSKPMKTFLKDIKPDITYYNSSRSKVKKYDIENAELMVEVKFSDQDDPFNDTPNDKGLLIETRARQTLGQMTRYATAHLAAQFRTHVFSILLFKKSARLMRWDRAGLIVSESIGLDTPELAEFFWRFSNANVKDRGYDPTVTPFKFTRDLTKKFLFDQLQFAADRSDVKVKDVNFFEVLLPRTNNRYVIGKPIFLGVASLASRATRTFKAWCVTTKKPVFLKDTWRILSASQRPEHEIYEKLAKANVQHIATVLDYGDIKDHLTQTGKYAEKSWACKTELKPFRTLQHYRLVLQEIGRSLTSFKDIREVLAAMRDALRAHRESYYKGRVLHRDISAGNVIIYNGGGLLIDWDMCKDLDWATDQKGISRTGTWAFQSLRLSREPKAGQLQVVHNRLDDLESFYHVLFWVSLQHAPHVLRPQQLFYYLTALFDDAAMIEGMTYADFGKKHHMTSTEVLEEVQFQNFPLRDLLLEISAKFTCLYVAPPTSKPSKSANKLAKQAVQLNQQVHRDELNFLNSDEESNWMELQFQEALAHSADQWGSTGYILNEITSPTESPTKRPYSDMASRYSQHATFTPSVQIVEEEEGGNEDEGNGKNPQPPRTRRRLR